jgi:hydroxymethylpyrimidine/phosphomethylpyrimidine kinase
VTAVSSEPKWLHGERVSGRHTHGTGCVLSAAIAARLARGEELDQAVAGAKTFVTKAIRSGLELGKGVGPVDPGGSLRP